MIDIHAMAEKSQSWLTELQPSGDIYTAGPMVHQGPGWFDKLVDPWAKAGKGIITAGGKIYEQLPTRLFELGMEKLGGSQKRTVQTGPGTSTTYVEPAKSGAAPASPYYQLFMPQQPAPQQQTGAVGTTFVIAALGIALLIFLKA